MILTALTSVTFRHLGFENIIKLAKNCGLECIEWGGDIHVPPNNIYNAEKVYKSTVSDGLSICSYGSYYKLGEQSDPTIEFKPILDTAVSLKAKTIRVWAGSTGSKESGRDYRMAVVQDAKAIADMSVEYGINIAFEYHRNTLTDMAESTINLLEMAERDNVKTYWQPNPELACEENLFELKKILPYLENVHVFHWTSCNERLPLEHGKAEWNIYYDMIKSFGGTHTFIIEFVKDGSKEQFKHDAYFLRKLIKKQ